MTQAYRFGFRSADPWQVAETPAEYVVRRKLFLDTTIPSYLTTRLSENADVARHQRITRTWWDLHRRRFAIYVSELVLEEARAGDPAAAQQRVEFLAQFSQLPRSDRVDDLANALMESGGLPPKAKADASHLATASLNGIRYLLTWNCKHLANPQLFPRMRRVLAAQDLGCPTICTPEHIMEHLKNDAP
ncbi:MAG TPA: type II toxin-antitoxin system VapC family toxin [Steroidobacteraceae bacterium]|jgi:predicted nucleic acid-binding protein